MKSLEGVLATIGLTVTVLIILGRIMIALWPPDPDLRNDEDAATAIDCLLQIGFSQKSAVQRVMEVRKRLPRADVNTLVNMALRQ